MKETNSETADNQAVLQSVSTIYLWLCKVNREKKRRGKKKKTKAYPEKNVPNSKKVSLTTLPSNPCGQLDATAERKAGQVQIGMHVEMLFLVPFGPGSRAQQERPEESLG